MNEIINNRKIAILLGVYNGEKYLAEQIGSLISQTYKEWTLYIRDDASTDNTIDVINKYAYLHDNIIPIIDLEGNLGCNGNYFKLLALVDSQYYMFCNADDFWFPNKIEISMKRMLIEESQNNNIPILVHTDLSITDANLNLIVESYWTDVNLNPEKIKNYNLLGVCSIAAGATTLFNKEVRTLTFPVIIGAPFFDHWIALQVIRKGIIATIHQPTIAYRQIGTNLAAVSTGDRNTIINKILDIKNVLKANFREAKMLRMIKWGGLIKYIYYKFIILFKIRFTNKYNPMKYREVL
jgi:glycosyltransferase involved in cell wall biosynthesis